MRDCSHGTDAVISLANAATLVSEVSSHLAEFAVRWIQSPSGFNEIVAATIPADWARAHRLVISRVDQGEQIHTLYTRFLLSEPKGMLVRCHNNCGQECKNRTSGNNRRFICMLCGSRTSIRRDDLDTSTVLGRKFLVETPFPQAQYPTQWTLATADDAPTAQKSTAPAHLQVPAMTIRTISLPTPSSGSAVPGPSVASSSQIPLPPPLPPSIITRSRSTSAMTDHRRSGATTPPPSPADPGQVRLTKRPTAKGDKERIKKKRR